MTAQFMKAIITKIKNKAMENFTSQTANFMKVNFEMTISMAKACLYILTNLFTKVNERMAKKMAMVRRHFPMAQAIKAITLKVNLKALVCTLTLMEPFTKERGLIIRNMAKENSTPLKGP